MHYSVMFFFFFIFFVLTFICLMTFSLLYLFFFYFTDLRFVSYYHSDMQLLGVSARVSPDLVYFFYMICNYLVSLLVSLQIPYILFAILCIYLCYFYGLNYICHFKLLLISATCLFVFFFLVIVCGLC